MSNEIKLMVEGVTLGALACSIAVAIFFYAVSMWDIMTPVQFVQSIYTVPLLIGLAYLVIFKGILKYRK